MTAANVTEAAAPRRSSKPRRSSEASSPIVTTVKGLAAHLGLSPSYVREITEQGVIERLPTGGYDQDVTRLRYLRWLRDPARRSARSEAESEHRKMKTRLLALRVAQAEGELILIEDHLAVVDGFAGLVLTELGVLPARLCGRDLVGRRKVEAEVLAMRQRIAAAAGAKAKELDHRTRSDDDARRAT